MDACLPAFDVVRLPSSGIRVGRALPSAVRGRTDLVDFGLVNGVEICP